MPIANPARLAVVAPGQRDTVTGEAEDTVYPRLYLSQIITVRSALKIAAVEVDALCDEAERRHSEPGLLLSFRGPGAATCKDWAMIPYDLFRQLLEAAQSKD